MSARLGGQVWDALISAGVRSYHGRGDGFDIFENPFDRSHVVVTAVCEGALNGTGPRVARQMMGRWIRVLKDAGYAVELIEYEGDPLGLVVAADEPGMRQGVESALASVIAAAQAEAVTA